jgi:ribose transport system permease protein
MTQPRRSDKDTTGPGKGRTTLSLVLEHGGPLVALAAVVGLFMALEPSFRNVANWQNIGRQMAVVAILAAGETFVIVAGGIDLSVGSVVALSGVLSALAMKALGVPDPLVVPMGICVGLGTGALVGALSGVITELAGIPSFVVTLGMLGVAAGAAKIASGGVGVSGIPDAFDWLAAKSIPIGPTIAIPTAAIVTILVIVVGQIVLSRTRFGRSVYALGGNREAARLSGVPTRRISIMTFVISGGLAGLAGIMAVSRIGSAQPTAGEGYELNAIAAAVIGGTSLMGGEGSVLGSFVGALIMAVIATGLDHMMVSQFIQEVVIGGMIIVAVIVDKLRRTVAT